ncbi:hypothetical protein A9174_13100 [Mesorhizobium loti NZP2037]|nr:hypothetical protein A9174_13100 [Mesorhizobium loti NZP2037]
MSNPLGELQKKAPRWLRATEMPKEIVWPRGAVRNAATRRTQSAKERYDQHAAVRRFGESPGQATLLFISSYQLT